ncbi:MULTISPECIES: class C beta-lactamase [unclassified Pseudomonas]|uniref:class C beta-lactamase n=1 Tax=unclassified Pseudomonas TaxID=196821 RepID=UPI0008381BEE|nr:MULTISPECIES: class C beta-lactamase [unclassified Pseudomonas]QIH09764.1 beta-lactamase [Pseudomonas sp. BIOMIG1BAC]
MRQITLSGLTMASALTLLIGSSQALAGTHLNSPLKSGIDATIRPLMHQQGIPGMAVAVIVDGQRHYFNYGVASKDNQQPVDNDTLFEVGSVSKTFTATLAGYAQANGKLALQDPASQYLPALRGSVLDTVTLLQLGTYTAGGLPLQFPDEVQGEAKTLDYYNTWKPTFSPGTQRQYSNPSLGLFGYLAARSLGQPFDELMEHTLFPGFALKHSYINVPKDQLDHYAQGYDKQNRPVRVGPGPMDAEAYGVKTSAPDLLQFVAGNLQPEHLDPLLQKAVASTQSGYYQVGDMTQGLGWERYAYPVSLVRLMAGNSSQMALEPHPVQWLTPAQLPKANALYNKTGSTNGFGAYVLFVPSKQIGIVLLANKNYPNEERVKAAHAILGLLESAH